jgi:hypothetical protein
LMEFHFGFSKRAIALELFDLVCFSCT